MDNFGLKNALTRIAVSCDSCRKAKKDIEKGQFRQELLDKVEEAEMSFGNTLDADSYEKFARLLDYLQNLCRTCDTKRDRVYKDIAKRIKELEKEKIVRKEGKLLVGNFKRKAI